MKKKNVLEKLYEKRDVFMGEAEMLLSDIDGNEDPSELVSALTDLSNLVDDLLGEIDFDTY